MSCHLELTKKKSDEGVWYFELMVQPDIEKDSGRKLSLCIPEDSNLEILGMAFRGLGEKLND